MLELRLVKEHCRLEPDFNADDTLIGVYIGAAKKHVEMYTRRT
ncbi:TPA: head-tail connector protein, partial [Serratia marcescens]